MSCFDKEFERRKKWKKGYISPDVCADGENSHKWENATMREDGVDYPIKHCKKCGYWM